MKNGQSILIIIALLATQSCYYDNKEDLHQFLDTQACDLTTVTYTVEVTNVMQQYCYTCHNDSRQDGGVNLLGYDNLKLYGQAGSLYGSIIHTAPYAPMPPGGGMIPQCDQDKIKAWIDGGMLND